MHALLIEACLTERGDLSSVIATAARAQESFKTTDEAFNALLNAARAEDPDGILAILGPDGDDIVSSGDSVADAAALKRFLAAYDVKHQTTMEGDHKAVLIIGQEDFPFPIPLVHKDDRWWFDTAAGRDEILYRRIGRNELDAIQASLAYVDAQNDYADRIQPAPALAPTRSASSVGRARRTGFIGRRPREARQAHSARSSPRRPAPATASVVGARRSTAITTNTDEAGAGRARRRH